jgi:hypothetical protein
MAHSADLLRHGDRHTDTSEAANLCTPFGMPALWTLSASKYEDRRCMSAGLVSYLERGIFDLADVAVNLFLVPQPHSDF